MDKRRAYARLLLLKEGLSGGIRSYFQRRDREVRREREPLMSLLQEHYGITKDKAEVALNNWGQYMAKPIGRDVILNGIQGWWHENWGHLWASYGDASNDDAMARKGRREVLAGMVQRMYGVSRQTAISMVDEWGSEPYPGLEATTNA